MSDLRVKLPAPCPESWDSMAPAGCNRHCASCDQIIFDLAKLTIDEAEALLSNGDEVCVRAELNAQGRVKLKSDAWANARRMIATVGAGAGLLAAGSMALAKESPTTGEIAGKVDYYWGPGRVVATGSDGKEFRAKIKQSGSYKLRGLPPGKYALRFSGWCGDETNWDGGEVVVAAGATTKKDTVDTEGCIIVGQLKIENHRG